MFSSMFVISSKNDAGFVAVDFLIFYIVRDRVLAFYVISGLSVFSFPYFLVLYRQCSLVLIY